MKRFLVICTSYFGDTILTGALCQNIKLQYPDSLITYIVNKPFYEAAAYLNGVDEVWLYDKKGEHKGLTGFIKFVTNYRSRRYFDAAFIIYGNERGIILARALGVQKVYAQNKGIIHCLLTNKQQAIDKFIHMQDRHALLLKAYSGRKVEQLPVKYSPPPKAFDKISEILTESNISNTDCVVAICTTTKNVERDMKLATCIEVIKKLVSKKYKVILIGAGECASDYSENLKKAGCNEFIDLVNKTTISELAALLQKCSIVISVDTGTLHLTLAVGTPVVAIFYLHDELKLSMWAPKDIYLHRLVADGICKAEDIIKNTEELLNEK